MSAIALVPQPCQHQVARGYITQWRVAEVSRAAVAPLGAVHDLTFADVRIN
jgi:hypothetical protein